MILAIETSSPKAGLALWDTGNEELIHEEAFSTDRAHNSVIFGYAKKMLEKCDRELDGIVVGLGPGSYSGVRVGIALANGLGLAMNVPAMGVSSLLAYSSGELSSLNYAVIGDARRKTRFIASIENGKLLEDPKLIPEDDFPVRLEELRASGNFDAVYTPDKNVAAEVSVAKLAHPGVVALAEIGAQQMLSQSLSEAEMEHRVKLEPHYLRPPYITTPKKRRS